MLTADSSMVEQGDLRCHLSVCLVYMFDLSMYMSIFTSVYLGYPVYPSGQTMHLSIHPSIQTSTHLSIHPPNFLLAFSPFIYFVFFYPSNFPSVHLSVYSICLLTICQPVFLLIHSVRPPLHRVQVSICICVYLFVLFTFVFIHLPVPLPCLPIYPVYLVFLFNRMSVYFLSLSIGISACMSFDR